ncbi:hypothetical protein HDV02_000346, partial [Globomyces sp. JEL0801]
MEYFDKQWKEFTVHSLNSTQSNVWYQRIVEAYKEPQRHYHTMNHINRLLMLSSQSKQTIHDSTVMFLSIIFHDIVYDPKSSTNELDSIKVFNEFIESATPKLSVVQIEMIQVFIKATIKHQLESIDSVTYLNDLKLFLDFDLEILSSSTQIYKQYSTDIFNEYHFVSDYNQKRIQVLMTFLDRSNVYFTTFGDEVNDDGTVRLVALKLNLKNEIQT